MTFLRLLLSLLVLSAGLVTARATEPKLENGRILAFDSVVELQPDGALKVTEHILVQKEAGFTGIRRSIPLWVRRADGSLGYAGFELLDVQRDGMPEKWFIRRWGGFLHIHTGSSVEALSRGTYEYTFIYRITRQVRFFPDRDELFWTVTGDRWPFPIDHARVTVQWPQGLRIENVNLFVGSADLPGMDTVLVETTDDMLRAETTRTLEPGEGFRIAVAFPQGTLPRPSFWQRWGYWLQDNMVLVSVVGGAIALNLYFFLVWWLAGRDPRAGPVAPRWEPPQDISPAMAAWVREMAHAAAAPETERLLSAILTSLAVKGYLRMDVLAGNSVMVEKTREPALNLPAEERFLMRELFKEGPVFTFSLANQAALARLPARLQEFMGHNSRPLLEENMPWFLGGLFVIALSVLGLLAAFMLDMPHALAGIVVVIMAIVLSLILLIFVKASSTIWWIIIASATILVVGLLSLVYRDLIPKSLQEMPFPMMLLVAMAVLAITASMVIWQHWLRRPTPQGRKLLDDLEGLKMFIEMAGNSRGGASMSVPLFEKLLPWAMALEREKPWVQAFEYWFRAVTAPGPGTAIGHHVLGWYTGGTDFSRLARVRSMIGNAIRQSMEAEAASVL